MRYASSSKSVFGMGGKKGYVAVLRLTYIDVLLP